MNTRTFETKLTFKNVRCKNFKFSQYQINKEHKVFLKFRVVEFLNGKSLQMEFGNQANSNMLKSMVTLTFSLLDRIYPSWTNLVQKIKMMFKITLGA